MEGGPILLLLDIFTMPFMFISIRHISATSTRRDFTVKPGAFSSVLQHHNARLVRLSLVTVACF